MRLCLDAKSLCSRIVPSRPYRYRPADLGSNVNVRGYPGNANLNAFYTPVATESAFHRYHAVSSGLRMYSLTNAWIWGGESGCPYYRYDSDTGNRYVVGVHKGGATGCHEVGRRLTNDWADDIRELAAQPSPPAVCQIVELAVDIYSHIDGALKGVADGSIAGPASDDEIDVGGRPRHHRDWCHLQRRERPHLDCHCPRSGVHVQLANECD